MIRCRDARADDVGAVVGDVGSYSCKMGFAGEDFPKAYFTSVRKRERSLKPL